jgi:hypothetical protein
MAGSSSEDEVAQTELLGHLRAMDDWDFEHLVADVFDAHGWDTGVEQQSTDKGVDVRATKSKPYDQKLLIQAKRYQQDNRVGGPEVQQYAALHEQEANVDQVIVVTTGEYTRHAKDRAEELNVKLINGHQFLKLIEESNRPGVLLEYLDDDVVADLTNADIDDSLPAESPSHPAHIGHDSMDWGDFGLSEPDPHAKPKTSVTESTASPTTTTPTTEESGGVSLFPADWRVGRIAATVLLAILGLSIGSLMVRSGGQASQASGVSVVGGVAVLLFFLAAIAVPYYQTKAGARLRAAITVLSILGYFVVSSTGGSTTATGGSLLAVGVVALADYGYGTIR